MADSNDVTKALSKMTGAQYVHLTGRGNAAIFLALYVAKRMGRRLLLPDQGGWLTYQTYPKALDMTVTNLKTDDGVVVPGILDEMLGDCFAKGERCAILISSYAGYHARHPIDEISEICHRRNCILIEDATAGIGTDGFCDARKSDVVVGSFGFNKPVNFGTGGFFATSNIEYYRIAKELFTLADFEGDYGALLEKLTCASERTAALKRRAQEIKDDLEGMDIIHRDSDGLNVIVAFKTADEKNDIIKYCSEHGLECTLCPRYIRVERDAVSIEVKRLGL